MKFYINFPKTKEAKVITQEDRCKYCGFFKTLKSKKDFQINPFNYMPLLTEDDKCIYIMRYL